MEKIHIPVLKDTIKRYFDFEGNNIYVDCTLGLGGHLKAFTKDIPSITTCVGIDMDNDHLNFVKNSFKIGREIELLLFNDRFENTKNILSKIGLLGKVTSILIDLGICSNHIDDPNKGFSFINDGPLDMRYNKNDELDAKYIVNNFSFEDLSKIIFMYGEEKFARKISNAIIENRKIKEISTTKELSDIITKALPRYNKIHPATKTFQALRIYVNNELKQVESIMRDIYEMLAVGGKVAVISYHSLEDRIVKHSLKEYIKGCICPKEIPICICNNIPKMKILNKKPIVPDLHEITENPRSRSAKLRIAEKIY